MSDRKHKCIGQASNNKTNYQCPDGGVFEKQPDNICPGCGGKQRTYQRRFWSDRQPCPKKHLIELLSLDGNRTFTITEKQFFGIIKGWTHLELTDEKSIFESIYETGEP